MQSETRTAPYFVSKCGKKKTFRTVHSLIEKASPMIDDWGDDFVIIKDIRYEPTSLFAWTMWCEHHLLYPSNPEGEVIDI